MKEILHSIPDYDLIAEVTEASPPADFFCVEFKSVFRTAKNPTEERSLGKFMMASAGMEKLITMLQRVRYFGDK